MVRMPLLQRQNDGHFIHKRRVLKVAVKLIREKPLKQRISRFPRFVRLLDPVRMHVVYSPQNQ